MHNAPTTSFHSVTLYNSLLDFKSPCTIYHHTVVGSHMFAYFDCGVPHMSCCIIPLSTG